MWPLRKKAPPAPISTCWKQGDIGECISTGDGNWDADFQINNPVRLGEKVIVARVLFADKIRGEVALGLVGHDASGTHYAAICFRKIVATGEDRKVKLTAPRPKVDA